VGAAGAGARTADLADLRDGLRTFALIAGGINLFAMSVQVTGKVFSGGEQWGAAAWAVELAEGTTQVALAALVWWVARPGRASRRALWAAGASLYVLLVAISTYYDAAFLNVKDPQMFPSWVCLTVLVYALLVPGPRRYHAALAGAATLAGPVAVAGAWAAGAYGAASAWAVAEASVAAAIPIGICAAVSLLVIARNVRRAQALAALTADLDRLGSYVLERKLGEGGMGDVWLARHDLLAMPAAIKRIKPDLMAGDEEVDIALARFEREARATAQLTSSHTISIYDFGRTADGAFYYVMELLEGMDLVTLVERSGPLPDGRVRHILMQACDSLGEAHAAGMIHRDVKPANIMLCRQGREYDVVKVLDFGLVRTESALPQAPLPHPTSAEADQDLTLPGTISGTPAYMSPEQIEEGATLDGRADLYALGCVAYFLLTGEAPLRGESAMMTLALVATEAPDAPSARRRRPLSPELEGIVLRLLSKDPRARYDDANALAGALRACPVTEPWSAQDARDFFAGSGLALDPRVDLEDSTRVDARADLDATRRDVPDRTRRLDEM
jgi:serine/threonine-protein kinase